MKKEFSLVLRAILFVAIAVGAWFVGIIIGQENAVTILNPYASTASIRDSSAPRVSMMLDYNNGNIDIISGVELTSHANLWEVMLGAASQDKISIGQNENYEEVGLQWYGVNGFYNNSETRWYIWLNNELQSGLPDSIVVKNRDVLLFKYLSYYPR